MDWLNYHHLFYFWRIAREGGLSRAAEQLHVTHSTLSAQLASLEASLGGELFERRGRRLTLTPFGEQVASYADDIFRLGKELVDIAHGRGAGQRTTLRVGVVGALPKTLAYELLLPGLPPAGAGLLVARQDNLERLLEELAGSRLHLILSDIPPAESSAQRVYAHLLGESGILLYGTKDLAKRHRKRFPLSLDEAPLLVPTPTSSLRRQLDRWFAEHGVRPRIEGEFDDAALMRVAGSHGRGLFPVREALRAEVEDSLDVHYVAALDGILERYYVVSSERRVRHPAVSRLIERGRAGLAKPMGSTRR